MNQFLREEFKDQVLPIKMVQLIQALEKPADLKTESDINDLIGPLLKSIQFFKSQNDDLRKDDLKFIAERLKFKFHKPNDFAMEYGERGHTFYIIIQGKVSVLIPDTSSQKSDDKRSDFVNKIQGKFKEMKAAQNLKEQNMSI